MTAVPVPSLKNVARCAAFSVFRPHGQFVAGRIDEVEAFAAGKIEDFAGDESARGLDGDVGFHQVFGIDDGERRINALRARIKAYTGFRRVFGKDCSQVSSLLPYY